MSKTKIFKEYTEALIIALCIAMVLRFFVVQAFKIPSGSMLQTLQIGDYLLVNKFIYGIKIPFVGTTLIPISDPERGDIVVFKFPEDENIDFIKRIVGVPGDTIAVRNKQLFRNGEPVHETYIQNTDPSTTQIPRDNFGPITVPEGKYFMMGDNRDESYDSRYWKFVDRDSIKGKAMIIYFSIDGTSIRWDRLGDLIH